MAERQGIPYLVADSVASNITGRGFKWTFRSGPIAPDFAKAYTEFLTDLKKSGRKINNIAIVNENTDYGTSVAASIQEAAKAANIAVAAQIPYNANSSDVSAQVIQLKTLQPDAVIFISYTADTILYFKTMKNLDYLPPIIIGDDAGFSDPTFIPNAGDLAQVDDPRPPVEADYAHERNTPDIRWGRFIGPDRHQPEKTPVASVGARVDDVGLGGPLWSPAGRGACPSFLIRAR